MGFSHSFQNLVAKRKIVPPLSAAKIKCKIYQDRADYEVEPVELNS